MQLSRVTEITKRNIEPVYDFETKPNHNYMVSNGLVIHNCDDALDIISQLSQLNIIVPSTTTPSIEYKDYNERSVYSKNDWIEAEIDDGKSSYVF